MTTHPLPFSVPREFSNGFTPDNGQSSVWWIFSDGNLLVKEDGTLPPSCSVSAARSLFMGRLGQLQLFAADAQDPKEAPPGWLWRSLRTLFGVLSDEHLALAGRALQLLEWDRSHRFCGRCGHATFPRAAERCRECAKCGFIAFPRLTPAILALVQKGKKVLLARGIHAPYKFYSALAGFVDPGETLEQCVAREVMEEVGLRVHNMRYFGSQPWPFSQALMIAFTCDWLSGEIQSNPAEIMDVGWYDASNLPELPPSFSLSRILIDAYLYPIT